MSESRKTLVRYSDGVKVGWSARTHIPSSNEQTDKVTNSAQLSSCGDFVPRFESTRISGRSYQSKESDATAERDINEAIKGLNIPFDEVVYQDLISLNDIGMKIKYDAFLKFDDRPRRPKKLDPEPDLKDFYHPTKYKPREFLYCNFSCKNVEVGGGKVKNIFHNFLAVESNDCVSHDFAPDAENGNESDKLSDSEELDLDSNSVGNISMKKRIKMHENYGLDPPKLRSYFNGFSLYERSLNWKV